MQRRQFLRLTSGLPCIALLPAMAADSAELELMPLIRLIEETPRAQLTDQVIALIRQGLTRQQLLQAIQLAGMRQIVPRPVGFKFHAVMMVDAARRLAAGDSGIKGWIPILWNLDYFKVAQARSKQQSDWRLERFTKIPAPAGQAEQLYRDAMKYRQWSLAEQAVVTLARSQGRQYLLGLLTEMSIRDFYSIGHKAIYISHGWRLLRDSGQAELELMLRAMSYALLAEDRPTAASEAQSAWQLVDYPANLKRSQSIPLRACVAVSDPQQTLRLLAKIQQGDADACCTLALQMIGEGASFQVIWDAVFLAAAEAVMRKPTIPVLHSITVSHSMCWLWLQAAELGLRRLIPLQALAYVVRMRSRFSVPIDGVGIHELQPLSQEPTSVTANSARRQARQIGQLLAVEPEQARRQILHYPLIRHWPDLRKELNGWLLAKSDGAHDFKYGAAVLETVPWVSQGFRSLYLAATSELLPGGGSKNSREADQVESWLGSGKP